MNYAFLLPTLSLGGGERFISEISQYLGKKNKKHFILIIYDNIEYTIGNSAELIILYKNPIITKIPKIEHKINIEYSIWNILKIFKNFDEVIKIKIADKIVKIFI